MRLLLAEDDPALANLVVELLTEEGHDVVPVEDLEAALRKADEGAWDLFLIDIPGRSSRELHPDDRAIIAALAAHAPVVLATGRAWVRGMRPGDMPASAVLPKPYDLDDLLSTIERVAHPAER